MASLDSLPADQRAVLGLVLQRGRSYDDIAALLSIDRAAVRQRALAALDALGPHTEVPAERRALITDYLLGQLPSRVAEDTRDRLAASPTERAWARVVASELGPIAPGRLPEIPVEGRAAPAPALEQPSADQEAGPGRERIPVPIPSEPRPSIASEPRPSIASGPRPSIASGPRPPRRPAPRPTSRRGGALLLGLLAAAIVAVVIVLVVSGGSSTKHKQAAARTPTSTAASSGTTTTPIQVIGQVNLSSPRSASTKGVAQVLRVGTTTTAIVIAAQNVPPNTTHDAYAVWLYNSASDAHFLGFVNPGVGSNGRLSTRGLLPSNAGRFKDLIVTLESTQHTPRQPGQIVLQGQLTGV